MNVIPRRDRLICPDVGIPLSKYRYIQQKRQFLFVGLPQPAAARHLLSEASGFAMTANFIYLF